MADTMRETDDEYNMNPGAEPVISIIPGKPSPTERDRQRFIGELHALPASAAPAPIPSHCTIPQAILWVQSGELDASYDWDELLQNLLYSPQRQQLGLAWARIHSRLLAGKIVAVDRRRRLLPATYWDDKVTLSDVRGSHSSARVHNKGNDSLLLAGDVSELAMEVQVIDISQSAASDVKSPGQPELASVKGLLISANQVAQSISDPRPGAGGGSPSRKRGPKGNRTRATAEAVAGQIKLGTMSLSELDETKLAVLAADWGFKSHTTASAVMQMVHQFVGSTSIKSNIDK
jgi:hypothetical protein